MIDHTLVRIEPLTKEHGRGAFCCGHTKIDNFVRNNARKDNDLYKVRVFVACLEGSKEVIGIYSLTLTAVDPHKMNDVAVDKFERVDATPAIYLAMLAVTEDYRKSGLSDLLIADAFDRALQISENAGAFAITLDAVHEKVAARYEEFGFERFAEGELKMFLPLQALREAKANEKQATEAAA